MLLRVSDKTWNKFELDSIIVNLQKRISSDSRRGIRLNQITDKSAQLDSEHASSITHMDVKFKREKFWCAAGIHSTYLLHFFYFNHVDLVVVLNDNGLLYFVWYSIN